jgi:hypothetical protein
MTSEQRTPPLTAFLRRKKRLRKMEDEARVRERGREDAEALRQRLEASREWREQIQQKNEEDAELEEMLREARSEMVREARSGVSSAETIRKEIRKANADSQTRGEKYGPNILRLAKTVKHALNERNLKASYARIRQIAKEHEFTTLRGPVGKRAKYR